MKIESKTIWHGRTGNDRTYFHPRAALIQDKTLIMTLQEISGSDYFHPVQQCYSTDEGLSWSAPCDIPDLGRKSIGNGIEEGVCDAVPEYHEKTGNVIAVGHNVYYKDGHLFDSLGDFGRKQGESLRRFPVYNVMDKNGNWLPTRKKLECPDFMECSIYSCGCSQKVMLSDGNILIPLTFGLWGRKDRMVTSVICTFDGHDISFLEKGSVLEFPIGRGLLEPSLIFFRGIFYMTIRAEDNHGYMSVSGNGLSWKPVKQWAWKNGETLIMSSTQQHWLEHKGKLYLIYTRKAENNLNVIRWRSPLFIAEFDTENECLINETEQVVFPMSGDGINDPDHVPMMGNFHALKISEKKAIVTDGDILPSCGWKGDTMIAYIS